ncbi:hypothetical protein Q4Q35_01670 [Flavivirga aquimarina]|uniref:HTH luxR-type domain-containing protein n=1 Tax=Flavivirga aquimarina TaxID=2027862 RepID=A0ABT8W5W4_9FLAO|nr:hypothetical protein [Flavivirga aquimarina]MDO5968503.1 hypothetical protein [Flavivirga aquimarina]
MFCLRYHFFHVCIILSFVNTLSYGQKSSVYERFVDSADAYIDYDIKKTIVFLDSIPQPVTSYIKKGLPQYYMLKSLIYDENNDYIKLYQSYVLALKYAVELENYKIAGDASLELFLCLYYASKDVMAYKHLKEARTYYELSDYDYGDFEVDLMFAYAKYLDKEYEMCNALILDNLEDYKKAKGDSYFYMFAAFMLTSNCLSVNDLEKGLTYFNEFKALESDPTTVAYNYISFESALDVRFANLYFERKQMDSTFYYLLKSSKKRSFMIRDIEKDYLKLYANSYRFSGNVKMAEAYADSLTILENKMYKDMMSTSFQVNNDLVKTASELEAESDKKYFNGLVAIILFLVLGLLSFFYVVFYRKEKIKIANLRNQTSHLSYLKSNNEKLVVKVKGLEGYISNLKKEIKNISTIGDVPTQHAKIRELYKALHLNSSIILDKSENHLDLINDLNVEFFQKINKMYPKLNNSEIIICYYLYVGFKSKEIAVFLNASVRSIESKRYRISKKIHINKEKTTLVEHLKKTFEGF